MTDWQDGYDVGYRDGLLAAKPKPRQKKTIVLVVNTVAKGRYVIPLDKPDLLFAVTRRLDKDGIAYEAVEYDAMMFRAINWNETLKGSESFDWNRQEGSYTAVRFKPATVITFNCTRASGE